MDLILHVADEFLLDKVWSSLVPACAFYSPPSPPSCSSFDLPATINSTSANSFWHSLITSLPHPPLPSPSYLSSKSAVSAWPRDYVPRQLLSLTVITLIGIFTLYFVVAGLSYAFIFNHEMKKHPRFLKNQVKLEIICSMWSFPGMTALTLPWFQAEVMGYTRLYDDPAKYGWVYMVLSVPL
jgi:lathosterol oxidase